MLVGILIAAVIVLAVLDPEVVPPAAFQGIRLVQSDRAWSLIIAAVALLPYLTALVLSSEAGSPSQRDAARGLIAGTAVGAIGIAVLAALIAAYGAAWAQAGGAESARHEAGLGLVRVCTCASIVLLNLALLWTTLRRSGGGVTRSVLVGGVLGLAYTRVAVAGVRYADSFASKKAVAYRSRLDADGNAAEAAVRAVAYCAITYGSAHRDRALPTTLGDLTREARCDQRYADSSAVPDYTLTFTANSGGMPGLACQATATFVGRRRSAGEGGQYADGRTMTATCAGMVFEHELRQPTGWWSVVGNIGAWSYVNQLSSDLALFSSVARDHEYPLTLSELLDRHIVMYGPRDYRTDVLGNQRRADLDSNLILRGPAVIRYLPIGRRQQGAADFEIEVRCQPYSPACMRSYLLDEKRIVHGTGEDRSANASDPQIESCEGWGTGTPCDGTPAAAVSRSPARSSKRRVTSNDAVSG